MNRGLKITLWVLGLLILIGVLSYGGWQIWTLMKQAEAARALHAQERDALKAQIKKLGEEMTGQLGAEIATLANVQAEALSSSEKQLKDSLAEARQKTEALAETQTKDQESVKMLATTLSTLEQSQQKLAEAQTQFGQKVAAKETQVIEKFTGLSTALSNLTKRTDNIVATEADWHYFSGVDKWDDSDLKGAIRQFSRTCKLNPKLPSAHYNLALAYWRKGQLPQGCQSAYNAGQCYLAKGDLKQAKRMVLLISTIDPISTLIAKLRREVAAKTATAPAVPAAPAPAVPAPVAPLAPATPIAPTAPAPAALAAPVTPVVPEAVPAAPVATAAPVAPVVPEVAPVPAAPEAPTTSTLLPEAVAPAAPAAPEPAPAPAPAIPEAAPVIAPETPAPAVPEAAPVIAPETPVPTIPEAAPVIAPETAPAVPEPVIAPAAPAPDAAAAVPEPAAAPLTPFPDNTETLIITEPGAED